MYFSLLSRGIYYIEFECNRGEKNLIGLSRDEIRNVKLSEPGIHFLYTNLIGNSFVFLCKDNAKLRVENYNNRTVKQLNVKNKAAGF